MLHTAANCQSEQKIIYETTFIDMDVNIRLL